MYISQIDLIREKLRATSDFSMSNVIKDMIRQHENESRVKLMPTAQKYYDDEHDILSHDFRTSVVYNEKSDNDIGDERRENVEVVNNLNNSNHHNVHNYFRQIIDQEADYIAGNPPAVIVEGAGTIYSEYGQSADEAKTGLKSFENEITKRTSDEEFARFIANTVIETRKRGNCFWHVYYGKDNRLRYIVLSGDKIIPVYDTAYESELLEVVRYYDITVVRFNNEIKIKRVEWWTDHDVTYYIQDESGDFVVENLAPLPNPAPHFVEEQILEGSQETTSVAGSWGRVPFVEIVADQSKTSLLKRIKGRQDAYNHLSSKLANDEIDLVSLFWVVQGYGGDFASSVRKKIELNKGVSIPDPTGKITAEQVELNTSERIAFLDMIKKDIFRIGEGLVPDMERSGNINTVELEMRYAALDMKAKRMVREIKVGLKTLFEFIVKDMGGSGQYDSSLVKCEFHFAKIIDQSSLIDDLLKVRGLVPDTIIMSKIPFIDDPNQAWIEYQKQREREAKEKANAYSVPRSAAVTPKIDGKITQAANSVSQ